MFKFKTVVKKNYCRQKFKSKLYLINLKNIYLYIFREYKTINFTFFVKINNLYYTEMFYYYRH